MSTNPPPESHNVVMRTPEDVIAEIERAVDTLAEATAELRQVLADDRVQRERDAADWR